MFFGNAKETVYAVQPITSTLLLISLLDSIFSLLASFPCSGFALTVSTMSILPTVVFSHLLHLQPIALHTFFYDCVGSLVPTNHLASKTLPPPSSYRCMSVLLYRRYTDRLVGNFCVWHKMTSGVGGGRRLQGSAYHNETIHPRPCRALHDLYYWQAFVLPAQRLLLSYVHSMSFSVLFHTGYLFQ